MPLPPPSAFPRLTPPSRSAPRFFLYTAANRVSSGITTHPIYLHPSVDHLIHPFLPIPSTINASLAASLASDICDELEERNLRPSNAEVADATHSYAGSFTYQNRCSCDPLLYHRANALDVLSPWGVPSVNQNTYTPYQTNGIAANQASSVLLAEALSTAALSRGTCVPLYMHDDDEGPDQAGLSNALGLKFTDSGSTGPGWWSVALADPRYSTTPIILDPATSRTYTLAEIVSLFPPPAIGDPSGFWSAASNQPFSRWLWSLTSAIAATTQHFGPNYGFRSAFPCMTFSEYSLSRTGGGPPQDLHLPNFGGTNNYSFLRLSTAFPFALPWTAPTHSQSGCSSLTSPRLPHESIPSFYIRQAYYNSLADPSPSKAIWLNAPLSNLTYRDSSGNTTFPLSSSLFVSLCCSLLHAGVTSFILFIPNTPYLHWDTLLTCINDIHLYARGGALPLSFSGRPSSATPLMSIPPRPSPASSRLRTSP